MFGCLRRIGCLVLILAALAAAWYWYSRRDEPVASAPPTTVSRWEPVTRAGAERGRAALEALSRPQGPPSVAISAGELASYIFFAATDGLPTSTRDLEAAVIGDQLAVRGVVPLRELGAARVLGPLASLISESDTLFFSGKLDVIEPGLGQYRVSELRFQQFRVPSGVVPRILRQIDRGNRPPEVAASALALPLPQQIGDITTAGGVVTLHRSGR